MRNFCKTWEAFGWEMPVDAAVEEQFGPYLVYERLGVGGMATVHRALEQGGEGFERMVALKRLLPHLAEDASFIKSFVREAKLASILNHVNIVQIYELGRVGTEYFISMEYIDGRDVRQVLRHARKVTGPPPIHVTVGLLLQLCEALDYAHNKADEDGAPLGLVHRDISPSNLIVTSGGHLKIIDFGIAKAQSNQLRTQTGRVKGKLAYMAPEAISGSRDLDARSDIWATGVILHELLTARPLFASKNEYQTLLKVQKGDILPPSTFNQACPPELDAIAFRALARHPDERFANAAELREELLELKKQYSLQTGYRDVSSWLSWAFGLEVPPGFTGDTSGVMSVEKSKSHNKAPRPPQDAEEEEAVEVVWGNGGDDDDDNMGPVVLDDVPDVSEKHQRAKRDTEDEALQLDDIPTPLPTHGTMPSIYGTNQNLVVLAPTTDPGLPPKLIDPALARGTDPPVARSSEQMRSQLTRPTGAQPIAAPPRGSTTSAPPTVKTPLPGVKVPAPGPRQTGQQPITRSKDATNPVPTRTTAPSIPVPVRQSDRMSTVGERPSDRMRAQKSQQMTAVDAPNLDDRLAAVRGHDSEPPLTRAASATTQDGFRLESDGATTNPVAKPLTAEDLFGVDAEAALSSMAAEMDAMATNVAMPVQRDVPVKRETPMPREETPPPIQTPMPVVRFSKSVSIPPMNVTGQQPAASYKSGNYGEAPKRPSAPNLEPPRTPSTKPGIAPVSALQAPHAREPRRSKPPSNITIGAAIAERAAKPRRMWIYVLGGVILAGGTATAVTLMLAGGNGDKNPQGNTTPVTAPGPATPVAPVKTTGTVKFVIEPADAEIKIGDISHAGSPFTSELPAGIHQIEIHKPGYKSWLTSLELSANESQTFRVVLDPLTAAAEATASLTVTTTPAGLDVLIDGQLSADKSPIKTTLKVGPHTIVVKQNGTEVWHQTVNAEAASEYEFNPSFTADKLRERAERAKSPTPHVAPKAPAPAPAPAPSDPVKTAPPTPEPAKDIKPAEPVTPAAKPTAQPPVTSLGGSEPSTPPPPTQP